MTNFQDLLSGEAKAGLYRLNSRASTNRLCREAGQAGWQCAAVDGRAIHDKASFLAAFAEALHFPSYFGHNWDAFEEVLHDLPDVKTVGTRGTAIIYDHADRFAQAQPAEWATARDILTEATQSWRKAGMPLLVLLRGARTAGVGLDTL
jgi:RNAse (barnase) inhibitor barstar